MRVILLRVLFKIVLDGHLKLPNWQNLKRIKNLDILSVKFYFKVCENNNRIKTAILAISPWHRHRWAQTSYDNGSGFT